MTKQRQNKAMGVKSRRNQNSGTMALANAFAGSMSVTRNPARERNTIRTRQFLFPIWDIRGSATVLSQTTAPGPLGSQYASDHVTIKPSLLSAQAKEFIQNSDRYRITKAELFVLSTVTADTNTTKATAPIVHYAYCDVDSSEQQTGGTTPWFDILSRDNVSKCTLRANNPTMLVASWAPRPLFEPTTGNDANNVVPSAKTWIDSLNLGQEWSGVRTYSNCPVVSEPSDRYKYALHYELRVTVQCQAAL